VLSSHPRAAEIRQKFTRSCWFGLVLPLAGVGAVCFALLILLVSLSHRGIQDQSEREAEVRVLESARVLAEQLSGELNHIRNLGWLLSGQVRQQLEDFQSDVTGRNLTSLSPLLKDIYHSDELVDRVYVNIGSSETMIYPLVDVPRQLYNLVDVAHYTELQPTWTDIYLDPAGLGWKVSLILPVVVNDRVGAVVGLDLTLDSLMKRLLQMNVPWGGYTLLMAADGTLLTFSEQAAKDWNMVFPDLVEGDTSQLNLLQQKGLQKVLEPLHMDASGLILMKLSTGDVLLSWSGIETTDWKLLQVAPASSVFAIKQKLMEDYRGLLWLGLLFLCALLLFLLLLAVRRDQLLLKSLLSERQPGKADTAVVTPRTESGVTPPRVDIDLLQLVNGPLMICHFDCEKQLLNCNSAFELFAGETSASLRGQKLQNLPGLKNLPLEDLPEEVELCSDQQEPVRYWVSQHLAERGDGLLLLLDVSHYIQQQQQLRSERQRAQQSARMKAEFFQVASRDAYKLLGELQQSAKTLDNASSESCHQKLIAIQRLLDDMRDMSEESDAEELRETAEDRFDLSQLVVECHAATESLLTRTGRQLQVVYEQNMPEQIQADQRRLGRLLKHLLRQASQFSERGDLHLSLAWKEPSQLLLRFNDQGGGAPEADRLKRFQSSTPLGSSYEPGTGSLGLGQLLTRQLVQEMKGSLDVKVRVDGGLQLLIELPVQRISEPRLQTRILVVDDGPVNAMLASSVLEKSGYLVDVASSGARALELGREKTYGLLLMDIYMPEMDGIETTQRWRQLPNSNAGIPVIALTAHALETDRERFIEQGLDDYLAKPYRPAELRERVSYWLNQKRGDS
jgi:CheY-like chemotaxis protein